MVKAKDLFTEQCAQTSGTSFDFFHQYLEQISKSNFPQAFFQLLAIFVEDSNYHLTKCYATNGILYVEGNYRGKRNELMLRYGTNAHQLIVARIAFIHKRKGNMTKLFYMLKRIKRHYGTGPIVIEAACSPEIKQWCEKNKLISVPNCRDYIERTKINIIPPPKRHCENAFTLSIATMQNRKRR